MRVRGRGFTLVEVLIALAISAVVATLSYGSLSSVMSGVESTRAAADRTYEINRAWSIISRDLRQFSNRPVRDEFGELEPALTGGIAARYLLSFTRSGWHNPVGQPRSTLQRINYVFEDEALWRESYPVLDRAPDSKANRVKLLDNIEQLELAFLPSLGAVEATNDGTALETRNWSENWITEGGVTGVNLPAPVAIEIRMEFDDIGEIKRLYALPPI